MDLDVRSRVAGESRCARSILAVAAGLACSLVIVFSGSPSVARAGETVDPHLALPELAARFSWRPVEKEACVVQIDLTGEDTESWHIAPLDGGDVELRPGPSTEAGFVCELDHETLDKLYRGELSGITAAGKDDAGSASPLEILPGQRVAEDAARSELGPVFHFLTHFFNRGHPERYALSRDAARPLHGAQMVGLFYHPGFRSAWYSLEAGERLNNQEGDTTPYPQAFVVMRGHARLRLGQEWHNIDEGEAIYIPAGVLHAVESRDGEIVELMWLAWGDGA